MIKIVQYDLTFCVQWRCKVSDDRVRGQDVLVAQDIDHLEVEEVQLVVQHLQVVVLKGLVGPNAQFLIVHVKAILQIKCKFQLMSCMISHYGYFAFLIGYLPHLA